MPQGLLWLLDLGLVSFHLKDLAQPMEDALAMDLPRSCFPSRGASLSSLGAGHEGEICFNPKASLSEERASLNFIPHLEVEMSPSHGEIQSRRGTDHPALGLLLLTGGTLHR